MQFKYPSRLKKYIHMNNILSPHTAHPTAVSTLALNAIATADAIAKYRRRFRNAKAKQNLTVTEGHVHQ